MGISVRAYGGTMETLFDTVRRHADANANPAGVAPTAITGLSTVRATAPSGLIHDISRPLVCLVVQGAKQVTMGTQQYPFAAGDTLLITANVPTVSQITRASIASPYYSLVMELDPAIIAELALEMRVVLVGDQAAVKVGPTDAEIADAALRLMRLLERPSSRAVLEYQLMREMHYWLLAGKHGDAIRRLGMRGSHVERVARAVAVLRNEFAEPITVERLASISGMGISSFHRYFRDVTSLSPLQFQKHLRLIEARRLMMSEGASATQAAFKVGYESVPQFTREYGRLFGQPPVRDTKGVVSRA